MTLIPALMIYENMLQDGVTRNRWQIERLTEITALSKANETLPPRLKSITPGRPEVVIEVKAKFRPEILYGN